MKSVEDIIDIVVCVFRAEKIFSDVKLIKHNKYEYSLIDSSFEVERIVIVDCEKWPDHIRMAGLAKKVRHAKLEAFLENALSPWHHLTDSGFINTVSLGYEDRTAYMNVCSASVHYQKFPLALEELARTYVGPFFERMSTLEGIYNHFKDFSLDELTDPPMCSGTRASRVAKCIAIAYCLGDTEKAWSWANQKIADFNQVIESNEHDQEVVDGCLEQIALLEGLMQSLENGEHKKYGL